MGTYIGPLCSTPVREGILFPHTRQLSCYRRVTSKGYPTLGTCAPLQYHFYNATCPHRCIHESLLVLYQLGNYYGRYRYLTSNCQNPRLTMSVGKGKEESPRKSKERQQTRSLRPSMWKTAPTPQSLTPPQAVARSPLQAARPPQVEAKGRPAVERRVRETRGSVLGLTSAPTVIGLATLRSLARGAQCATPMATTQQLVPGATSASPSAVRTFVATVASPTRTP